MGAHRVSVNVLITVVADFPREAKLPFAVRCIRRAVFSTCLPRRVSVMVSLTDLACEKFRLTVATRIGVLCRLICAPAGRSYQEITRRPALGALQLKE